MFWRRFKLDWSYAVGELVIVTLGVLIALGIQQWNEDRLERIEEKAILGRFLDDLHTDLASLDYIALFVAKKEESLNRLQIAFASDKRPADPDEFLLDVLQGAILGWNQPTARSRTFEGILSSGEFRLIRSARLRGAISDYYGEFAALSRRTDARETAFPRISYELVQRSPESEGGVALLDSPTDTAANEINQTVDRVLESELRHYVIAETNVARFVARQTQVVREQHQALIAQIETYRDSLEK
jgi:hypothetical protein